MTIITITRRQTTQTDLGKHKAKPYQQLASEMKKELLKRKAREDRHWLAAQLALLWSVTSSTVARQGPNLRLGNYS